MKKTTNLALASLLALALTACGGSVKRMDEAAAVQATGLLKVVESKVVLSDEAQKKLADNIKFDSSAFASTIDRTIAASGLVDKGAGNTLQVTVTSIYIRGTFSAVMFGVLAGADNITGQVKVVDSSGKTLRGFEVSASYAFGGWGGGQDGIRMNYLYEKFAELTRDQLKDVK